MKTKTCYRILGIMSGTSLDGVDFADCKFSKGENWHYKIKKTQTIAYSKKWRERLSNLHKKSDKEIDKTNIDYGKYLAQLIFKFKDKFNLSFDYIASHGHTIFHQPEKGFTLQIGEGQTIANFTQITTICDFRSLDISLGGEGAPLVPIGDLHLFSKYKYCINLGGFSNISIKGNEKITAFDICPVNIVLNQLSKKLGFEFDKNGALAKKGKLIPEILNKLNHLKFYKKNPPKSLGREWVEEFIGPIINSEHKIEDLLHTFCEHIAMQIGKFLKDEKVLISGGGTLNSYLIYRISHYAESEIIIPSREIVDYKEALIFGFLGVLKLRKEINCLHTVTGAKRDSSAGEIFKPQA